MRAIFSRFDHFLAMFVAVFGVVWSTVFMPLLGGPLHVYEAQAIGAGWRSLNAGANINQAIEIATSLPVEAVFPSASAAELGPNQLSATEVSAPPVLDLLGGPDETIVAHALIADRRPERPALRITPVSSTQAVPIEAEPVCDGAALKRGACAEPASAGV